MDARLAIEKPRVTRGLARGTIQDGFLGFCERLQLRREAAMALDLGSARRPCLWLVAVVLGTFGLARPAIAQLQTTDPYDPYGTQFKGYAYPGYVPDPFLGNRSLYMSGPAGANQLQNYYQSLQSPLQDPRRGTDRFSRFDQSFRALDEVAGRTYQPNADVDGAFFEAKQKRDRAYFRALQEKDPKKKAALMQEFQELAKKLRDLSAPPRTRGASAKTGADKPGRGQEGTPRRGSAAPPVPGLAPRDVMNRSPAARGGAGGRGGASAGRANADLPELPFLEVLARESGEASAATGRGNENSTNRPTSPNPSDILQRAQGSEPRSRAPEVPGTQPRQ
jgi:hypothetical protein